MNEIDPQRVARIERACERIIDGREKAGKALHDVKEYISKWPGEEDLKRLLCEVVVEGWNGMAAGAGELLSELGGARILHELPPHTPELRTKDMELAQRVPMLMRPIDDSQRELFARELAHIGDDTLEGRGA